MKRIAACIILFCLFLSGCSGLLDGSYVHVTPHRDQNSQTGEEIPTAENYQQLLHTVCDLVASGAQSGVISVSKYDQQRIAQDTDRVIEYALKTDPIGAYAVEGITYDIGTSAGQPAISLRITYHHNRSEIRNIKQVATIDEAQEAIATALNSCDSSVVLYVEKFQQIDFAQWVSSYAALYPEQVMEMPEVTVSLYPDIGTRRVVELKFTYQNSRDALRTMQRKVGTLFTAAKQYVSLTQQPLEKFSQMYSFLMERFDTYQIETSITPAYSLLQHGVGDSKAFATVFAAMCTRAELECITVTGTKAGEPWHWNIICINGEYFHVDLMECDKMDDFMLHRDADMNGYVWDYSAYPACVPLENNESAE